ncbi:hypothetical protein BKA70DRAFT_1412079 [Coprinopsis sp. MPI-PUGE-AT-0042]|nr:hypothetical protein BKA70DRAFT_1412079 [Coprinopsis sp. MPI-PUGE-AT-0042]
MSANLRHHPFAAPSMSSEQTKTPKESRAKKWLRRFRGGSPSPAAQASAPSTPQSIASTGSVPRKTWAHSLLSYPSLTLAVVASLTSSLAPQHTESEASSQSDAMAKVLNVDIAYSNAIEGPAGGDEKPVPGPSGFDVAKDYLSVTGSFLQLVLKKVPDAVDSNPVKVVFSLAKAVLELKELREAGFGDENAADGSVQKGSGNGDGQAGRNPKPIVSAKLRCGRKKTSKRS